MCARVNAELKIEKIRLGLQQNRTTARIRVDRRLGNQSARLTNVRVTVIGAEASGKSTLISVLTRGVLDNGNGLARMQVLR